MKKKKMALRQVPCRDDFYMSMAFWVSAKSKDPSTQIGAVIISKTGRPLGYGYNGPSEQFDDDKLDWSRPNKYDYVQHAEENAIDYSDGAKLKGSTIYVTHQPCKKCILKLIKNNVARVVYFDTPTDPGSMFQVDKEMNFKKVAEIISKSKKPLKIEKFKGDLSWMEDRMKFMKSMGIFDK